jgi:hypothetical protein
MGFFDDLAETAFKKSAEGSEIYYPTGVLGKGRVVSAPERRRKLFNYHKRIYKYLIPLSLLYGLALGFDGITRGGWAFIGVVLVLVVARQRYLINGLPIYGEKLRTAEALATGAKAFHPAFLLLFGVSSLFLIVGGAATPFVFGSSINEVLYPMLGIVSMGLLGLAFSIYLYRARKSNNSIHPPQRQRG